MSREERQIITIGTKLRVPLPPDFEKHGIAFHPAAGETVTVISMVYYRGRRNEMEHDLVLEVEQSNGQRFSDVYYHFEPVTCEESSLLAWGAHLLEETNES